MQALAFIAARYGDRSSDNNDGIFRNPTSQISSSFSSKILKCPLSSYLSDQKELDNMTVYSSSVLETGEKRVRQRDHTKKLKL